MPLFREALLDVNMCSKLQYIFIEYVIWMNVYSSYVTLTTQTLEVIMFSNGNGYKINIVQRVDLNVQA